ncbi:DNA polymerase III subunit alpha [Alicyclobacillus macrosporangiidus]|uniref:DNA polymerase III subunit alpha n=1 Tax=Alicyclobacillus macrosporangiidus TaxID=392015 RepID=A0A1I7FNL5_9BACL|nr:DNA polymerase III subunit alpha [Alicyclobacillus macrosporangiidus]SFU37745.1 error-prone DNA polymerase [Alicyclobacillus macrosporangiidus]
MFLHLHCHSCFSFLDGAAGVEALVAQAALLGMKAIALTDHNTIAGLPSFHKWAAAYGVKPISGAEITLEDGSHLTVLAETRTGYANLCRLLTLAHTGPERRRDPRVPEHELLAHGEGLIVLSGCRRGRLARHLLRGENDAAKRLARVYRDAFPGAYFIELQADGYPGADRLHRSQVALAKDLGIPVVATGDVHHVHPEQAALHDVLTCIRLGCDIHTPHPERPLNHTRWLFSAGEAERRFAGLPPEALANTVAIAERCDVVLPQGGSLFPRYRLPEGWRHPRGLLRHLVWRGARERYGRIDAALRHRIEHELEIIERLGYTDYFLTVWDIVDFARRHRIRCAGRGSAADSAVAYCLYITDVDAAGRGLLFERFMSLERAEKPDIDIDFDSRRRDEVMDYVYRKYGADHVARVATYQTFRGRSAVRDIGAALGLPEALLDALAKRVPWAAHADRLEGLFERLPELREVSQYQRQLRWLWRLAAQAAGFPRHFGMHLGGVVISARPLLEVTSLQPSAKGEWMTPFDKEGVEDVGLVKLDLLSLRTMAAIEDTVVLRERQGHRLDYDRIPLDDRETFAMLGNGETIGVFQLESPAQRALQARLKPEGLEDIVASVALIRPGPIKGNMVDPFLLRRHGQAPITYLHPKLEPILGKTYGVVLFQEQVIEIATEVARFTPGEADQLRRVMSRARSAAEMERIGRQFLEKAEAAGVDPAVARTIFSYIQGYASYGFCEAHAAAFATTAYKTAYLVCHFPAEFYASILNQYPMGYYPVHVVCAEARRRGIRVLGPDVNRSTWACQVEDGAIRLGFCRIHGFREAVAEAMCEARERGGPFESALDLLRRVPQVDRLTAEHLIRVGAFDGLHPSRRAALWALPAWLGARSEAAPWWVASPGPGMEPDGSGLPGDDLPLAAKLMDEYRLLGVGVSGHWLNLYRPELERTGHVTAREVESLPDGSIVRVAGLVVRPHRPPTRSGKTVVFFTLEDETGFVDVTMFESVYQSCGAMLFTPYGRLAGVAGEVQRRGGTKPQVVASAVWPLT